jgi:hypothetical protein
MKSEPEYLTRFYFRYAYYHAKINSFFKRVYLRITVIHRIFNTLITSR